MNFVLTLAVMAICMVSQSTAYYHDIDLRELNNTDVLDNFTIIYEEDGSNAFPQTFKLDFDHDLSDEFNAEFVKMENSGSKDVYRINTETNEGYKHQFENHDHEFELYTSVDGRGAATLIRNDDGTANKFRVLATVFSNKEDNMAIDIAPINVVDSEKRSVESDVYDASSNAHQIVKRSTRVEFPVDDLKAELNKPTNATFTGFETNVINIMKEKRRNLNRALTSYIVELLTVADCSTFEAFKIKLKTNDKDRVFAHIKVYYAQALALVNTRYELSLKDDKELKIKVVPANFLIFTDLNKECGWSNPAIYGAGILNGRQTLVGGKSLDAFAKYMEALKPGFEYDHASGVFIHDMLGGDSGPAEGRNGPIGLAYVSRICTPNRYSIIEEGIVGSFALVGIITHELGHSLGANHDGEGNSCSPSNNNVMSPSSGSQTPENQMTFSSCSIDQFKTLLLKKNGGTCLGILSNKLPAEAVNPDMLPGLKSNVHEQCKFHWGPNYVFAGVDNQKAISTICSQLWCTDINKPMSSITKNQGAIDGTPCGSGKLCVNMKCVADKRAPVSDFPFGDGIVGFTNGAVALPNNAGLKCADAFALLDKNGVSINAFCRSSNTAPQCPFSCARYNQVKCRDMMFECARYGAGSCKRGSTFNIDGKDTPYDTCCARTCKGCQGDKTTDYNNVCINGGTLSGVAPMSANGINVAFKCSCPAGYTGMFCESLL